MPLSHPCVNTKPDLTVMPKYLLTLLAALFLGASTFAQTRYDLQPVDEQDVCFLYAEFGLPNSNKVKVVVFTSYIYRYRWDFGYGHPSLTSDSWRTELTNAFSQKLDRITRDEHNTSAINSANQVMLKSNIGLEWAYKHSATADGTGPELYQSVTSATTFNLNVRNRLLKDYQAKGYKIFQVTFDEFYDDDTRALRLEQVHKLSSLDYETYRPGVIKALARQYQETSSSSVSTGSLTVSDSRSSNSNKKSTTRSNSNSSSGSDKDSEYWRVQAEMNRLQAESFEAEGERLYKLGTMFYGQALEKFQAAQRLNPTPRVQARINEINSYAAAAQAINAAGEGIEKGINNIDPEAKTRRMYSTINYTGLKGSYNKITNSDDQAPMGTFIGIQGHRVLISFEVRFGYLVSPVYEYSLERMDYYGRYQPISDKLKVRQTSIGGGLAGGLNIPLGNLLLYGMYGYDLMAIPLKTTVLTPDYKFEETPILPMGVSRITFGSVFRIPKTGIALGVLYNLNSVKGDEEGVGQLEHTKDTERNYSMGGTTDKVYKFNNLGVSFSWTLDK